MSNSININRVHPFSWNSRGLEFLYLNKKTKNISSHPTGFLWRVFERLSVFLRSIFMEFA